MIIISSERQKELQMMCGGCRRLIALCESGRLMDERLERLNPKIPTNETKPIKGSE